MTTCNEAELARRFSRSELEGEELAVFEEHLLSCTICQDEVELAERFDRALAGVAAEDGLPLTAQTPPQPARTVWVLAALLTLALALPVWWLLRDPSPNVVPLRITLSPLRTASAEPDTLVSLAPHVRWVALALEVDEEGPFDGRLLDAGTRSLWQQKTLQADPPGIVVAMLPAHLLAPGTYRMELNSAHGEAPLIYTFQVEAVTKRSP